MVKFPLISISPGQTYYANNCHHIISMTVPPLAFRALKKTSLIESKHERVNVGQ